jgi:hypothetical protein
VRFASNRSLELLLDAMGLLPRVGPSLVLAATALETRIAEVLDLLEGRNPLPGGLWQWINDRGDYRKEPSTAEQFDVLLRVMSGRSLKDDAGLWEAFQNLRDARNSFVHEGVARIGKRPEAVTVDAAGTLIQQCWRILEWLDEFVPVERRVLLPEIMAQVEFARVAIAPT